MRWLVRFILLTLGSALICTSTNFAEAQSYPTQPVRILVPYAAGGTPDIISRVIAPQLSQKFGQSFLIENKAGGSGIPAVQELLRSPADGHTILMSDTQTLCINPFLHPMLSYHPARDFSPVTYAASVPLYLAVQSSLGVNTLAELIALAKAKPGELTYGSSGNGSIHHIAMESFNALTGANLRHIPYRGAAQSVPAFIRGEISVVMAAYSSVQGFLDSGKIKLLAISSLKRAPETPDVAPLAELLKTDFDFSSEMGFSLRAGTPQGIVESLSREIVAALRNPDNARILRGAGVVIEATSAAEYKDKIVRDLVKFEKAVKTSGAMTESGSGR
jgi:tripartite-type tricarboxylate transporter receptor subunit TctC